MSLVNYMQTNQRQAVQLAQALSVTASSAAGSIGASEACRTMLRPAIVSTVAVVPARKIERTGNGYA